MFLGGGGAARPKGVQKWGPELSLRFQRGWLTARSRPTGLGLQERGACGPRGSRVGSELSLGPQHGSALRKLA